MGSQRPYAWFKYFHEFGLYPIVITRHWGDSYKNAIDYIRPSEIQEIIKIETPEGTLIRVPYNPNYRDRLILKYGLHSKVFLRKIITILYSILQYIFFSFDSRKSIYFAADEYIKEQKPDFIIATGEPFILFRYASKLSKKHAIPWIADYRDYWSKDFNLNNVVERIVYACIYMPLEKHFVKSAHFITTVGQINQTLQQALFPKKRIEIILNGFFEEEYKNIESTVEPAETFIVAFGGTIHLFNPLELFLEGLSLFIKTNRQRKICVKFYGSNFYIDQKERILYNSKELEHFIATTDRLSRSELFTEYNKASCLLIFGNGQMVSGKFYEYLPMRKRILMVGKDNGPLEQIINNTKAGVICDTAQEVAEALEAMYAEWESTGTVKCVPKNIEQYSRRHQTKKLANLIENM